MWCKKSKKDGGMSFKQAVELKLKRIVASGNNVQKEKAK